MWWICVVVARPSDDVSAQLVFGCGSAQLARPMRGSARWTVADGAGEGGLGSWNPLMDMREFPRIDPRSSVWCMTEGSLRAGAADGGLSGCFR